MRYLYGLLLLVIISCNKEITQIKPIAIEPTIPPVVINKEDSLTLSTNVISFTLDGVDKNKLYYSFISSVSSTINYEKDGLEHLISCPPLQELELSPFHFIKKNSKWELEQIYRDVKIGSGRNYDKIKDGSYAFADHGIELQNGQPWPYGHIWKIETIGEKLSWTQVSKQKSFYHSVSMGDLDQDGDVDIIGSHMGSYNINWESNNLHTYINENNNYVENRNLVQDVKGEYGTGSIEIADIDNDGKPEIIRADYAKLIERYSIMIYKYNSTNKTYELYKMPTSLGVFNNNNIGSTSIKTLDFDKDGDLDIAVAFEGQTNGIEILENKGDCNFVPNQKFEDNQQTMQFREFEVVDVNKDGYEDIIIHPFHFGTKFRLVNSYVQNNYGDGIRLENCIWINKGGKFNFYDKELKVKNIKPGFLKGFMIGGKLKFIGFEFNGDLFKIQEITINNL
jgi:hypothetical protein